MRALGALLLLAGVGCATSRLGNFSVLSTQGMPAQFTSMGSVRGEDCVADVNVVFDWMFSWADPPADPSVQVAYQRAIEQAPGADALINVEVDRYVTWAGYVIWGSDCAIVRGSAVKLAEKLQAPGVAQP